MSTSDWVCGDRFGLMIPAHIAALRGDAAAFLTAALHAAGELSADNRVSRVNRCEEFLVGGTGRKALLSIEYEQPAAGLHTELFVKFSRDFHDANRDKSKHLLEPEVRFALLSRSPDFPITVPHCLFGDYHYASSSGLLITERVPFGVNGIAPALEKCFDYAIPNALEHYRSLLAANAQLAGAHKAGRLGSRVDETFPYDVHALLMGDRIAYGVDGLAKRIAALEAFAAEYPQLLPAKLRSPAFLSRFAADARRFLDHETPIKQMLYGAHDFVALCHWNANIDNAWFWRNFRGTLECGLLDWGRVGQLNVAQAIFGSLCAAETDLWDHHLDELLEHFIREFRAAGGPELKRRELKLHVQLFTAMMGLAWLLSAPSIILQQVPALAAVRDRFDPRLTSNALARIQLQLLTVFLNAWQVQDLGSVLEHVEPRLPRNAGRIAKTPTRR